MIPCPQPKVAEHSLSPLGDRIVPTPEEAERAKIIAAYRWFRQRLVVIIFGILLVLQFMTWRSIEEMRRDLPRSPPRCSTSDPCVVSLDEYTIGKIRSK
jgi:hypothetical protein